jgi:Integrase zinc binding domain
LYLEEFLPDIQYINGECNVVADGLSCLPVQENDIAEEEFFTCFTGDNDDFDYYPLSYSHLQIAQNQDSALIKLLKQKSLHYSLKKFHGGGKDQSLICYKDKIVVPKKLQKHITHWYHTVLCHPGINRTEVSIGQHLWWPKMRDQITNFVTQCSICQLNKRQHKKFGELQPKIAETIPWDKLCMDLIGPYTIRRKGKTSLICKCVTMIDPDTGWFEIDQYNDKKSIAIANIVEQEWFS